MTITDPKKAKIVVKNFFFKGVPAKELLEEFRKLTDQDFLELANGIQDESFTY